MLVSKISFHIFIYVRVCVWCVYVCMHVIINVKLISYCDLCQKRLEATTMDQSL